MRAPAVVAGTGQKHVCFDTCAFQASHRPIQRTFSAAPNNEGCCANNVLFYLLYQPAIFANNVSDIFNNLPIAKSKQTSFQIKWGWPNVEALVAFPYVWFDGQHKHLATKNDTPQKLVAHRQKMSQGFLKSLNIWGSNQTNQQKTTQLHLFGYFSPLKPPHVIHPPFAAGTSQKHWSKESVLWHMFVSGLPQAH